MRDYDKEQLKKDIDTKLKTTFIGAIASIEKHFGIFWNDEQPVTKEELANFELFEIVRTEILDNGNKQIRNFEKILSKYDISRKKYKYNFEIQN